MSENTQIVEIIIDGAPGSGKSHLINNLKHKINVCLNENVVLLVNGARPDEEQDELVLEEPKDGSVSFIQKRYDPLHCYKKENICSVMYFHECSHHHDEKVKAWIRKEFPNKLVINVKERDGPSSSVIFNWTSYKDIVLSTDSRADSDVPSWNEVFNRTNPYISSWMEQLKNENIKKHFIYLHASPHFILQRVKERNRKYEAEWFNFNLSKSLSDSYDYFFGIGSDLSESLSHTIFDLYDQNLTTISIFDAQRHFVEEEVLKYLKKFVLP